MACEVKALNAASPALLRKTRFLVDAMVFIQWAADNCYNRVMPGGPHICPPRRLFSLIIWEGREMGASVLIQLLLGCCSAWLLLSMQPTHALTSVTGIVYCDQCLVGRRSIWSIPLEGVKVSLQCNSSGGVSKQGETDVFGHYSIKVDASSSSLEKCSISLISSPSKTCSIAGVSHASISLSWKLFGVAFYSADALSYKPSKPMPFCPNATHSNPNISLPFLPFAKLSACPSSYWVDPKYKCYWRLISPDTKVSFFYGEDAGKKYGFNTTLWDGLHGGGEIHKVLLRETVAASLNAFNSLHFYYNAISVDVHFNQALHGSDKDVLRWALAFRRANSGYGGKGKCLMTPCK